MPNQDKLKAIALLPAKTDGFRNISNVNDEMTVSEFSLQQKYIEMTVTAAAIPRTKQAIRDTYFDKQPTISSSPRSTIIIRFFSQQAMFVSPPIAYSTSWLSSAFNRSEKQMFCYDRQNGLR